MTSDLCADDVLVHVAGPQVISSEAAIPACSSMRAGAGGGGAELGRRLLVAARAGDTPLVLDLMAKGSPFTTDWLGTSPLHLAASNAHLETCAVLLRAGVSRDSRTKVERTPLHLAAYAGHEHVAALLLDHGALLDCRDMLRMTPLHWAVQRGHVGTARELLRRGADPTAVSKFGATPLSLAGRAPGAARPALQRLLEDAVRAREAARSVRALVSEQMPEEARDSPPQPCETIQKIQNTGSTPKLPKAAQQPDKAASAKAERPAEKSKEEKEREGAAAQLLRRHGITLLPTDDGTTVLSALQSGRSVVLSDAGKLMLKESGEKSPSGGGAGGGGAGGGVGAKGVLLTATPVKSPPRAGVKIFTLNNNLLLPTDNGAAKKIINPQELQVKYVQVPAGAAAGRGARPPSSRAPSRPVKIILNRANFSKLIAPLQAPTGGTTSTRTVVGVSSSTGTMSTEASEGQVQGQGQAQVQAQAESVLRVPDEWVAHCSHKQLRAHAVQARLALAALLRHCRAAH